MNFQKKYTKADIHRCSTSRRLKTVMLSRSGYGLRRMNFGKFSNSLPHTDIHQSADYHHKLLVL